MENKEKEIKNEELAHKAEELKETEEKISNKDLDQLASSNLRYHAKEHKNDSVRRTNRLWLWLGVLILIFILIWWLWSIGIFEDLTGVANG